MEKKREVKVYKVDLFCDECGGEMYSQGISLMSNPPMYLHECKECGAVLSPSSLYPKIVYENKENEEQ